MKKILLITGVFVLAGALLLAAGCGQTEKANQSGGDTGKQAEQTKQEPAPASSSTENVKLTLVGYVAGTSMQVRADALAEALRKGTNFDVTSKTGTGLGPAIDAVNGKIDMFLTLRPYPVTKGMLQKDAPDVAVKYKESLIVPTDEKTDTFVALADVPISSIPDMIAKKYPLKLGVGGAGSTVVVEQILQTYDISLDDIEKWGGKVDRANFGPQVAEQMKDNILQAHFVHIGLPEAYLEDLAAGRKIKLLPIAGSEEELQNVQKVLPEMYRLVIKAGTYTFNKDADVPTVAFAEYLSARPDLPEDVVYQVTKSIWENTSYLSSIYDGFSRVLQKDRAIEIMKIRKSEIHPGAMRYYQEKGWLN